MARSFVASFHSLGRQVRPSIGRSAASRTDHPTRPARLRTTRDRSWRCAAQAEGPLFDGTFLVAGGAFDAGEGAPSIVRRSLVRFARREDGRSIAGHVDLWHDRFDSPPGPDPFPLRP